MALLSEAERAAFAQLAGWTAGDGADFKLDEIPAATGSGWVTVFRRSTRIARTYTVGAGEDWLALFRRDLEAGIFDARRRLP
jgi:hypothetical protein